MSDFTPPHLTVFVGYGLDDGDGYGLGLGHGLGYGFGWLFGLLNIDNA